jgi:hypothetical protein
MFDLTNTVIMLFIQTYVIADPYMGTASAATPPNILNGKV